MKLKLIVGQFSHIRGSIGTKFNFSKKGENIMKAVSVILMVILFSAAANAQDLKLRLNDQNKNYDQTQLYDLNLSPGDRSEINEPYKTFVAFVGLGVSVPVIDGDFSDDFSSGINVNGGAGYRLSDDKTLRFGLQYNKFNGKRSNPDLTITSLRGDLVFGNMFAGSTNFYGYGGIGVYFLDIAGFSETNFGFSGGAGATFRLSSSGSTFAFVEASLDYNANDGSAKGFIPLKAGIIIIP